MKKHKDTFKKIFLRVVCVILLLSIFSTSVYAGGYPYMIHLESPDTRHLNAGAINEHTFIAPVTGEYEFFTTSTIDTYGRLLQGQNEIDYDDDSGENHNFSIKWHLTGGVKYRILVSGYSESTVGNYTLTVKLVTETFCLRNMWQGKYLTAANTTGLNVGAFSVNQRLLWNINSRNGGFYTLISNYYHSNFSQFVALTYNQPSIKLQSINSSNNQSFEIVANNDNTYRIMYGNLALTVNNTSGATGYGTEVILAAYTGSLNQKWSIEAPYATLSAMKDYEYDASGVLRDFGVWIDTETRIAAKTIAGLASTLDVSVVTDVLPEEIIKSIKNSYYFAITTHGSPSGIECYTPTTGHISLDVNDIDELPDGYFKGTKCVVLNACLTAQGGAQNPNNFANTLHSKGAQNVVAFKTETYFCIDNNSGEIVENMGNQLWIKVFTEQVANGTTLVQAVQNAKSEVYRVDGWYCGLDSCHIVGNDKTVIKRPS